jgi:hypothetical protein
LESEAEKEEMFEALGIALNIDVGHNPLMICPAISEPFCTPILKANFQC